MKEVKLLADQEVDACYVLWKNCRLSKASQKRLVADVSVIARGVTDTVRGG